MISKKNICKKVVEYLSSKDKRGNIIVNRCVAYQGHTYTFDIVVVDENNHIQEFYEIKVDGVSSGDVKKHNAKYEEYRQRVSTEAIIAEGALGYLVTYDKKKKDFDLYLITEEIDSLSKYVEVVLKIATTKNGYTNYYRGQGNIEYSLLPGLYRKKFDTCKRNRPIQRGN